MLDFSKNRFKYDPFGSIHTREIWFKVDKYHFGRDTGLLVCLSGCLYGKSIYRSSRLGSLFCSGNHILVTLHGRFCHLGNERNGNSSLLIHSTISLLAYKIPQISIETVGGVRELFAIEPTTTITFAAAITIIIGAFISGGTQAPNWARFAKTPKTAFSVGFLAFLIGNVVMAISGMLGGLVMQEDDMVNVLLQMGIIVWAMFILIFNIWTTNTTAAYSFGVAGAEFFNKPNKVPFVIGGLIIATIMAVTGIYEVFISFLTFLGIFVPSLGGLIIGDYLFNWRKSMPRIEEMKFKIVRSSNLIAYVLATLGAYLTSVFEIGLPPLNGILLGIGLVYVMKNIYKLLGIDDRHQTPRETEVVEISS